jgi:double-stranded uracil-DNA glycosylase
MTDLVKRATPRAAELGARELQEGMARVTRLVEWLAPAAVVFVGMQGYRAAIDRSAQPGWQASSPLAAPTYLMPSTSGLNAATSLDELSQHLAAAASAEPGA